TAAAGMAHAALGTLHYEWNELDAATERLARAIELGRQAGIMELVVGSSITLSRLHQAQGDLVAALDRIDAVEQLVQDFDVTAANVAQVRACRASLLVAAGDLETAARLLEDAGLGPVDEVSNPRHTEHVAVAQVLLAQGMRNGITALEEANRLLVRLTSKAEAQGRLGHLIQLLCLRALVLREQGAVAEASTVLARALALGEPEGYVRSFVDAGPSMRDLLRQALPLGIAPEYVRRLLATFERQRNEPAVERAMMSSDSAQAPLALVEPLSERELEVLRLVAAGLSNREIAEQLVITVGTVKWHINNIYGKMDVRRRTEAVALAREMGLL
ncbi:MAG TPA: LuxR C-terminal-related transcriptional regulator, partial [Anaerolineae bacterium]|nr:LuxR C-terminal-related transcriptional regulator [Anaerolineae bacterium]